MKEALHKITSMLMALIVLFSTLSFSVDTHSCGDYLVDFSIFGKADNCLMKAEKTNTSSPCDLMEMELGCCSDEKHVIEGQDDLKISFDQLTFDQQLFVVSFACYYINLFEGYDDNIVPFDDYNPPPLIRDVQVLNQTFLI